MNLYLNQIAASSGNKAGQGLTSDDKESIESFRELAKMHQRKRNFLELRLRDPDSLYEIDEVKARLKPKRQALNEQQLVSKGMMRNQKFEFVSKDSLKPEDQHRRNGSLPDKLGSKQQSEDSEQTSARLQNDSDNADDTVFQFVRQEYLFSSKRELINIIKEL